jgi:hypothetical protein
MGSQSRSNFHWGLVERAFTQTEFAAEASGLVYWAGAAFA